MLALSPRHQVKNSMPLYEENYLRVRQFLPFLDAMQYASAESQRHDLMLLARVTERFRYALILRLELMPLANNDHVADCCLEVRVYLDARVAEVIGFQGHNRFAVHYDYPNKHMYLPDEKYQLNLLLREMLLFCQRKGLSFKS